MPKEESQNFAPRDDACADFSSSKAFTGTIDDVNAIGLHGPVKAFNCGLSIRVGPPLVL